jgi:nucleoside-diphosphate-sugar epimerase
VNLGSGMEILMRELAALIARHVGYSGEIEWDATKPNGQPRRSGGARGGTLALDPRGHLDVSRASALRLSTSGVACDTL